MAMGVLGWRPGWGAVSAGVDNGYAEGPCTWPLRCVSVYRKERGRVKDRGREVYTEFQMLRSWDECGHMSWT